jgi:hypothetical protein
VEHFSAAGNDEQRNEMPGRNCSLHSFLPPPRSRTVISLIHFDFIIIRNDYYCTANVYRHYWSVNSRSLNKRTPIQGTSRYFILCRGSDLFLHIEILLVTGWIDRDKDKLHCYKLVRFLLFHSIDNKNIREAYSGVNFNN